ncbi:hypothetical protein GCM10022205_17820 [Spinactinospora alkalitolerans]
MPDPVHRLRYSPYPDIHHPGDHRGIRGGARRQRGRLPGGDGGDRRHSWEPRVYPFYRDGAFIVGRFEATRGLAARTPALRTHHAGASPETQVRLVAELEAKLGVDGRKDVAGRAPGPGGSTPEPLLT